ETFHSIFLGHPLAASKAVDRGGHPLVRPVGAIDSLLVKAVPAVALYPFADRTTEHAQKVFDTYLLDAATRGIVKAGVRMRLAEGGVAFRGPQAYFYGIRINIDLRQK